MNVYGFPLLEPSQVFSLLPICNIQYAEASAGSKPTVKHCQEYKVGKGMKGRVLKLSSSHFLPLPMKWKWRMTEKEAKLTTH